MIEFKHCFLRTGIFVTESKEYYKKADFSTINKILKSFKKVLTSLSAYVILLKLVGEPTLN